ncbi:MAG: N-acetylmuramoyl-L-alanine amidase [Lachnospiraceae bacterium]|nr:N-acetylmuramoyl-L-alanine amidase [Lachnospiraceae bacterium]
MKEKLVLILMAAGVLLLGSAFLKRAEKEQAVSVMGEGKRAPVVVIDAGHGGKDPGKVGVNGALEKEINLQIALRLKSLLEQNDVAVVLTREEDKDLASEQAASRKNEDLRARAALIAAAEPVVMVSIHQNSYPEEEVDGAQVFYYAGSDSGKMLGSIIQNSLKSEIDDGNHRVAKANKEYYLLKKATCPAVIIECGFLSNPSEAALLATEEYQEKLAFAIHLGIMEYINTAPAWVQ